MSAPSAPRPLRPGHRDGGQATVELALAFPVVLVGMLLVVQLALVARDQLLVSHATREAARAAAVEDRAGAARDGAVRSTTALDPARLHVDADRIGERVTVRVRYHARTALPLVGVLLPDPMLRATVTMRMEGSAGAGG